MLVLLAVLVLYLALFAAKWSSIVKALYLNSDIASGPVITEALAAAPSHAHVVLGNYPWFEALGWMSLIRALPGHRFLWEAAPFALAVAAIALVAWGTRRAAGRDAAMLTLAVGLGAFSGAVGDLDTWAVHGLTWVHAALLGWLAVWLAGAPPRRRALAVAASVGIASGPALASDVLLIAAGLFPLCAAAFAVYLRASSPGRRTDRMAVLGAAVLAVALTAIGALVTVTWAHAERLRGAGTQPIQLASVDRLPHNLHLLWQSLATLGNGDVFNVAFGASTAIHAVCAGLTVIGILAALYVAWSALKGRPSAYAVAHTAFWGSAIIALMLAFVLTAVPANSGRYLVGVLLAVAALVPLAANGRLARPVVTTAIVFVILAGVVSLLRGELTANSARFPTLAEADEVKSFVDTQHATVGYAGYWDAAPLTWASRFALHVYPVSPCRDRLCPFEFHRVASWYIPRPGVRSYVVLDEAVRQIALRSLPPALGKPAATANVGPLAVLVFDHDVARDFGPPL